MATRLAGPLGRRLTAHGEARARRAELDRAVRTEFELDRPRGLRRWRRLAADVADLARVRRER
jgi:hypothetical protein